MNTKELAYLSIRQAARLFRRRELSPVEMTHACLERIERLDGQLHCFLTVTADRALADARAAEKAILAGEAVGPLCGIPIGLKDNIQTAELPTTAHSRVLAGWVPAEDAAAFACLRQAGMVLVGKLAMFEFGHAGPSELGPAPRNPWNVGHGTGGSSSGCAAGVAAGLCVAALGTDTGGSIRNPSALCGLVGLKPTYGRVSRYGVLPVSWSLDHCGPMARTVEDAALLLQAIAGPDPRDPSSSDRAVPDYSASLRGDLHGLRVGVIPSLYANRPGVDAEVLVAVEAALRELQTLGAVVAEVEIPNLAYAYPAAWVIISSEVHAYHAAKLRRQAHLYGRQLRQRVRVGGLLGAADYLRACRIRSVLREEFAQAMCQVDVIITPTGPRPAPPLGASIAEGLGGVNFTRPFSLVGLPAVSVPCGFTARGLPIGMQIVARPFEEETILRVAHTYEQWAGWFERHPRLDEGMTRSLARPGRGV